MEVIRKSFHEKSLAQVMQEFLGLLGTKPDEKRVSLGRNQLASLITLLTRGLIGEIDSFEPNLRAVI